MTLARIVQTGTYRDLRLSVQHFTLRLRWSGRCWVLRGTLGYIISKHDSREHAIVKARKILRGMQQP